MRIADRNNRTSGAREKLDHVTCMQPLCSGITRTVNEASTAADQCNQLGSVSPVVQVPDHPENESALAFLSDAVRSRGNSVVDEVTSPARRDS
ncbi:hypothetical protein Pla52n_51080 [Stieleria varia]|uniref:Uncharacterized protein n=1 Tax=Stieleria varia TaxID=2528005 RepID=A0A5C6AHT2_9BACT|nr:hypothetical protein Pla52n_51080 [Stieleria varia]